MSQNGYTRQSSAGIVTGATILASGLNAEYNQLVSAFDNTSGHRHDGSVTGGGPALVAASLTSITSTTAGILGVDGANGFTARVLTGTSGKITVTNGDGTIGNPTITIDAAYIGQNTITTLGTITTGVWNGTTLAVANGGTGAVSLAAHSMLIGNGTSGVLSLLPGTSGNIAISNGTDWTSAAQTNITSLGTITAGTWNATVLTPTYGGTGVNNGASTLTMGGSHTLSGAFASTFTFTNTTSVTFPTSGTLCTDAGSGNIVTVGTIGTGTWQGSIIAGTYGGTGVNNGAKTITLGGNLVTSGAFNCTLTLTAATNVTLPTSGTLVNTAVTSLGSLTSAATLATVGTIGTGVWQGTKIGLLYGGTNADLSATGGASQVLKQVSSGAAITVGQLAFSDISSSVAASQLNGMSSLTASLGADVLLNNTATYFDGPSIAQGTSGTWLVMGTVTLTESSAATIVVKLWDGTTVIDSCSLSIPSTATTQTASLSGIITTPAGNLRISAKDTSNTTGKITFNTSGNSKDSTITAIRIG